ncbi:unnamed protein product [Haemonchus placei]|uniref:Uncharacterized protein n=1 Tax=Haemonchus placei TaxID=6290 RepID=A0A0N4WET4_HAEPC|nr:unnamed protein product [Haemonchus placei]
MAVIPALTYASETWILRKQDEHAVSVTQCALGRMMLGISLYMQVHKEIRCSELRHRTKIRDAPDYDMKSKTSLGRPRTRWSELFARALNERNAGPRLPEARAIH